MERAPNFFLTTAGECTSPAAPRACWERQRVSDVARDDYMVVDIDPPLVDERPEAAGYTVPTLVVATRHRGLTLYPITGWPTYVYVGQILDPTIVQSGHFARGQVQLLAWGALYPTYEAAARAASRFESLEK